MSGSGISLAQNRSHKLIVACIHFCVRCSISPKSEQALSAVDEASSLEGHDSFFPHLSPSTEVSNPSSFGMNEIANNPRLRHVLEMEKPRQNPWQTAALVSSAGSSSQINLTSANSKDSDPSLKALAPSSDRLSPGHDEGSTSPRSGKSGSIGSGSGNSGSQRAQAQGLPVQQLQHKMSGLSARSARTRTGTISSNASSGTSSAGGLARPVRASFDTFGRA